MWKLHEVPNKSVVKCRICRLTKFFRDWKKGRKTKFNNQVGG